MKQCIFVFLHSVLKFHNKQKFVWFCYLTCRYKSNARVTPFGLFSSVRNSPIGSLVPGTHAEAKLRAIKSLRRLRAGCIADLPGALLQTKLWSSRVSTAEPQWQWCGMQRSNTNRKPTATFTASSSNLSPHEALAVQRASRHCAVKKLLLLLLFSIAVLIAK